MTVAPDTSETPAVQIALEERRKRLADDLPALVDRVRRHREVLAAAEADQAFVERQLVELDAALAAPAQTGVVISSADDLERVAKDLVMFVARDRDGAPFIVSRLWDVDHNTVHVVSRFGSLRDAQIRDGEGIRFPLTVVAF